MNTLSKIIAGIALSFSGISLSMAAAPAAAPPPNAAAPIIAPAPPYPMPEPPYPLARWPYNSPPLNASTLPIIDKNAALYLPYLPWLAQNMALLVNYADFFYQLEKNSVDGSGGPFNSLSTTTANTIVSQTRAENRDQASQKTASQIKTQLSFSAESAARPAQLMGIPGTDTVVLCKVPDVMTNCSQNPPNDEPFNADSIFGTLAYPTTKNQDVDALISFLSNLIQPLPDPGLSTDPIKRAQQLQRGDMQSYILAIRSLVSLQSMAISNFNFLAKEREIVPDLGEKADMKEPSSSPLLPPKPIKDASQLQLEQYLIDKRLNNAEWYAKMNTAPSIAVQRETLYVLAELQRQMFELRMINERMLATLSTMQMGMAQMSRSSLEYQAKEIKKATTKADAAAGGG